MMTLETASELENRLIDFAVAIGQIVNQIDQTPLGRHIASQLVRSGTAAAPHYAEACAAESRRDFVHKLAIALKELRETRVWLSIAQRSDILRIDVDPAVYEATQLARILAKSIITAKSNGRRSTREGK